MEKKGLIIFIFISLIFGVYSSNVISESKSLNASESNIFESFFESNCSYKTKAQFGNSSCEQIQFNRNYQVEVFLPVLSKTINNEVYVPFLVNPDQPKTTISQKTLKLLGLNNNDKLVIAGSTIDIEISQHNILGFDFLQKCKLAMDYLAFEVGMQIQGLNGSTVAINWPLEAFKNEKLHFKAEETSKKYLKLKKKFGGMEEKQREKFKKTKLKAEAKEKEIKALTKKLAQLKEKKGNLIEPEPEEQEDAIDTKDFEDADDADDDDDDNDDDDDEENENEKEIEKEKEEPEEKIPVPPKNRTKKA